MIHPTGPGAGLSPQSAAWSMLGALRNAHAELRATQRANGNTSLGDGGQMAPRPVPEVQAGDLARRTQQRRGEEAGLIDPLLTGPRPTFSRTPLEKMRTDAFLAPVENVERGAPPQGHVVQQKADTAEPAFGTPKAAYSGLREIEAPKIGGAGLDMTT